MHIIGWIFFGLVVGALAKLFMPGRDPGGIFVTMLLGISGSLLGGFIGRAIGGAGTPSGWIGSIVCAMLLLLLYRLIVRPPTHRHP
ncbi:MAG TPA: GlsB/YeaQ/YmgE family stress response membrane protein [Planctomycetota bacterium]|nr:GlsB/YeaQ/YmgE family stress response membrane protein [Planctomycetota bacterium]